MPFPADTLGSQPITSLAFLISATKTFWSLSRQGNCLYSIFTSSIFSNSKEFEQ